MLCSTRHFCLKNFWSKCIEYHILRFSFVLFVHHFVEGGVVVLVNYIFTEEQASLSIYYPEIYYSN